MQNNRIKNQNNRIKIQGCAYAFPVKFFSFSQKHFKSYAEYTRPVIDGVNRPRYSHKATVSIESSSNSSTISFGV